MSVGAIIVAAILGIFDLLIVIWLYNEMWSRNGHLRYLRENTCQRDGYFIEQHLFWGLGLAGGILIFYLMVSVLVYL